ncbi:MAG: 1-deoxy-D-xylulose-5-phosphate synthase [Candidatus Atribacteria bacterium]|nr:1-deoxy-D-xylulose-5-phosphate synthase [Candidatus Atribacteria bacterium]
MENEKITNLDLKTFKSMSNDQLIALSKEIRSFLIKSISKTGGHIGANLGTIELSIALHYCFNSPEDKIVWDTGHQGYAHKILTGRAREFNTLNTFNGMSRFVSRSESKHDIIDASHAGTSLSIGLGLAITEKLNKKKNYVISVIGNGSLCEGMALEALNHISSEKNLKFIIILNDNSYAISKGSGALYNYLENLKPGKNDIFFTSLGYEYMGPIEGHNIKLIIDSLNRAKELKKIPIIHVKTEKGHGYSPAKDHIYHMHFSFPFDIETGKTKEKYISKSYQDVASEVIMDEMSKDSKIIAITPSTIYATGLQKCFDTFPERCFDPGMEEQHAMTLAAGLALGGFKPIIFYQTTFMQRAFDQLFHDVCFMSLPVMILGVRSGFAGYDSPTHHGIYDFAYLKCIPNLKIMYPKDINELKRMIQYNLSHLSQPLMIFMPYGPLDDYLDIVDISKESDEDFQKAEILEKGEDLLIITVGNKFKIARDVYILLQKKGIDSGLINLRYLKPLPEEQLVKIMGEYKYVVTIEEYVLEGGVGSSIANLILDNNIKVDLIRMALPNIFAKPGSNEELTKFYGLDCKTIFNKIIKRWFI